MNAFWQGFVCVAIGAITALILANTGHCKVCHEDKFLTYWIWRFVNRNRFRKKPK